MKTVIPKVRAYLRDPHLSLAAFLGISLLAATVLVVVGHLLYITSSEYKLDITRPGLKDIKKTDLVQVDSSRSYDSTSPITKQALDNEQKSMSSRQQDLDRYGDFGDNEINGMQDSLFGGSSNPGQ
ncbi:MAG TPA: hypothetical protein VLF60_00505 [Candidatus Saccharimonadales bacterium]|nr:hypothetical protein [Candidatus Saccharimonadales bacterium]